MRTGTVRWALLGVGALLVAGAAVRADSPPSGLKYVRLYSDAHGVSHFAAGEFPFNTVTLPQGGDPISSYSVDKLTRATFLLLRRGAFENWHPVGRPTLLVAVRGMSEVQASDGEVRRIGAGTVLLMEDTTGKGHTTRSVGEEDHLALLIPLAAPAE
jgi:hypothetical protein